MQFCVRLPGAHSFIQNHPNGGINLKPVVTCGEMKSLDSHTITQMGVPSEVLMERAALAVVEEILRIADKREKILVVCGSGNNGGDGLAIARLLHLRGIRTHIFFQGNKNKMTRETALQWKIARNYQVPEVLSPMWEEYTTIVDAVFGVGLLRPIEGEFARVIAAMNEAPGKKVAVDLPSGVNGDNGRVMGVAFRADLTVTFAFRKRGLCLYPGRMYSGRVVTADIGICEHPCERPSAFHMDPEDLRRLPARRPDGNKGTFGKVLLVAGSEGMCGAAFLSAAAALKTGAGMVKIQTVEANRIPLQTLLPEAMISCAFRETENEKNLNWCDVLVIGPGLGTGQEAREKVQWFLFHAGLQKKPVILDADGLNLLAENPEWKKALRENVILTPHMGEMSRLCGKSIPEIKEDPIGTAGEYSAETGAVCVLKDACTVTVQRRGVLWLNLSGNAGMATAGSGDVLSGVLAGMCCMYLLNEKQDTAPVSVSTAEDGNTAAYASALGVYIHGLAGDLAARNMGMAGMTAGDIIRALPQVLSGNMEPSGETAALKRIKNPACPDAGGMKNGGILYE